MSKFRSGYALLSLACLITASLWFLAKPDPLISIRADLLTSTSQLLALMGLLIMSANLLLTTRLRFLSRFFGDLDESYRVHHRLGTIAFVLLVNHPIMLTLRSLQFAFLTTTYLFPGPNLIYDLGIAALYSMVSAFVFIHVIKLPYHIWKLSHRLLGAAFILGSSHAMLISSDISRYLPLRYWMLSWVLLGTMALLYTIFFYRKLASRALYIVSKVKQTDKITSIWLKPLGRKLQYRPGQFAFVSFENQVPGPELHPFSFASDPVHDEVRLSVKILGDYTAQLINLKKGDRAVLYGPYGNFADRIDTNIKKHLWIAGGIGITPFLSMPVKNDVVMVFSFNRPEEEKLFLELTKQHKNNKDFRAVGWDSRKNGRLSSESLAGLVPNIRERMVLICGPLAMMRSLRKQLLEIGLPERQVAFENFDLV